MWGRKSASSRIDTLVGQNTNVIGNISFDGGLHVDGFVKGDIDVAEAENATLIVSSSGVVDGNINVPNVVINGVVKGDVRAASRLELAGKARVSGSVYYEVIEISCGAEVNGKMVKSSAEDIRKAYSAKSSSEIRESHEKSVGGLDKMVSEILPDSSDS